MRALMVSFDMNEKCSGLQKKQIGKMRPLLRELRAQVGLGSPLVENIEAGMTCCQQSKRRGHYINAQLSWE
jgi:hypothetical protein